MLIYLYLFAAVVGGVLLAASVFMGGDAADADVDADAELEVDGQADAGHAHSPFAGTAGIFGSLFSLRFWTFFATFFGLTGLVLDGFELIDAPPITLAVSILMGSLTGYATVTVMRALQRGTTGQVPSVDAYAGQTGRVLLPFGREELGKVRLQLGGTTVDVLARTDDPQRFVAGEEALVVEMQDTTALVARIESLPKEPS